jgi:hypothetical protein
MDRAARCMAAAPGHAGVDDEPIPDKERETRNNVQTPRKEVATEGPRYPRGLNRKWGMLISGPQAQPDHRHLRANRSVNRTASRIIRSSLDNLRRQPGYKCAAPIF